MRLDKFLQITGLIKRRILANEACKRGLVQVNDKPAKPTREIEVGDIIDLNLPRRETRVKLLEAISGSTLRKADRARVLEIIKDVARVLPDEDWWVDEPGDPF